MCFFERGSIEPDKWKDYPHHFGVDHKLKNFIIKSRRHLIDGNITAHLECLGIAFHYVADKWTLFSGSAQQHADWEDKIDKCTVVGDLNQVLLEKLSAHQESLQQYLALTKELYTIPRSKDGTLAFAFRCRPMENNSSYSTPEIDFNFTFRICLAIAMSVRSMTTPPTELVKALNLLTPWSSPKELSDRTPPTGLESSVQIFLSRFQPLEKEIAEKRQELDRKKGNLLKNFLFRCKVNSSIHAIEHGIKGARQDFRNEIETFIREYQQHIDWYYWGKKLSPSLWRLEDLFENNDTNSREERQNIMDSIQQKTFSELIALKKHGYQIVVEGSDFTLDATYWNTSSEVHDVTPYFYAPDNCKVENKQRISTVHPNWGITEQLKIQTPSEHKLATYLIECAFTVLSASQPKPPPIQRFPSYEKWGEYEARPVAFLPNDLYVHHSTNNRTFAKIVVVTEKIRQEWTERSLKGFFCGAIGCDSSVLDWKCPKCGLYFCSAHKNHAECRVEG